MIDNDLKSAFGLAFVRAVAHCAGFLTAEPNRELDGDGVDLMVFARDEHGLVRSPRIELQVKTTQQAAEGDPIPFDLRAKNHDERIDPSWQVPRILVVVFVPPRREQWIDCEPEQLVLRRAGYWCSLRGQPRVANGSMVRVRIPRANLLDVTAIRGIMARVRGGKQP
ncbi:MAG: DUF4365 domain-containing protein [Planctomycetota bacterium]|jgi:hypothetical protein